MGQAKQRKAEIMALKVNGPKQKEPSYTAKKITAFGAYYKDLDDDGVSIQLSSLNDPKPGFTEFMHTHMAETKDDMIKDVRNGSLTTAEIHEQLKQAIRAFNYKVYGSHKRGDGLHKVKIDVLKCMQEIVVIISDIWALTELGVIKNDNYNGMQFGYTQNKI
tara:strand:+ start:457 stop:942 length:486 start_codon:yes stop_codon:yes gene_type:complete